MLCGLPLGELQAMLMTNMPANDMTIENRCLSFLLVMLFLLGGT